MIILEFIILGKIFPIEHVIVILANIDLFNERGILCKNKSLGTERQHTYKLYSIERKTFREVRLFANRFAV